MCFIGPSYPTYTSAQYGRASHKHRSPIHGSARRSSRRADDGIATAADVPLSYVARPHTPALMAFNANERRLADPLHLKRKRATHALKPMPEIRRAIITLPEIHRLRRALAINLRKKGAGAAAETRRRCAVGDVGTVGVGELEGIAGSYMSSRLAGGLGTGGFRTRR
jgi:hypothetical protein